MPPLLPLSHFIGTGYVKNLLALRQAKGAESDSLGNFTFAEVSPANFLTISRITSTDD